MLQLQASKLLGIKTKVAKLKVPRFVKSKGKLALADTSVIYPHEIWGELSDRPGAIERLFEPTDPEDLDRFWLAVLGSYCTVAMQHNLEANAMPPTPSRRAAGGLFLNLLHPTQH